MTLALKITFRLSYRDPEDKEKYMDDDEMWNKAETMLKEESMKWDYHMLKQLVKRHSMVQNRCSS